MKFFSAFAKGSQRFGKQIGGIINAVLLTLAYLIGVGITAIIAKIAKKRFLELQPTKERSYWRELGVKKKPMEDYYRQF